MGPSSLWPNTGLRMLEGKLHESQKKNYQEVVGQTLPGLNPELETVHIPTGPGGKISHTQGIK